MTEQLEVPTGSAPSAADGSGAGRSTEGSELSGNLGTFDVVVMVLAYAGPLAIVGLFLAFVIGYGVGAATPLAFMMVTAGLGLFAIGYVAMSRQLPRPGALYTYVTAGLGRPAGLSAGFLAILTYCFFGVAYHAGLAIVFQLMMIEFGGPAIDWRLLVFASIILMGLLGHFRIMLSAKILSLLMVVEVTAILIWDTVVFVRGGPEGRTLEPLSPLGLGDGSLSLALLLAAVGFVGFETTAVFRDEMRDPARTVPRATFFAVTSIGLFYVLASWAAVVAYGPGRVTAAAQEDPAGFFPSTVQSYIGSVAVDVMSVMLVMSYTAGVISEQNILSRYFHALGADGVLPRALGRVHARHGSPYVANVVTTAALVVLFLPWFAGSDATRPYGILAGVGLVSLNVVMTMASVSVFAYFRRSATVRGGVWTTAVAPPVAALLLGTVTVLAVLNFDVLTGDDGLVSQSLLAAVAATGIVGLVVALGFRRRRPQVYRRIGRQLV